ncbi:unnamed protein product, partial [Protopolystoma xenopodis]
MYAFCGGDIDYLLTPYMNSQAEPKDGKVNREKTCPLLLRVFCGSLKHNSLSDYSRGKAPGNELQIYTWLDATLRELSNLVKQVNPEVKRKGTIFDFAVVTPDSRAPVYRLKNIGSVCAGVPSDADRIMLKDCQFCIGDMIDVAITPPQASSQFHIRSSTLNARGGVIRRQIRTFAERPAQSSGPWAE